MPKDILKPDCLSEDKYLENLDWAARSYNAALKGNSIPCRGCGQGFELLKLFRCFHCGSYFCPNCAKEHFGDRQEALHDAVKKANCDMQEAS